MVGHCQRAFHRVADVIACIVNKIGGEMKQVELKVRATCGSCERVAAQIAPVVEQCGAQLTLVDVDASPSLNAEFGDRVPVVVIDGDEFACWEVDNADLAEALSE